MRLLVEAAHAEGADHLVDGAPSRRPGRDLLLRMARGSGVYGLSGMAPIVERDGMRIVRPLLGIARPIWRMWSRRPGLAAVQDPHNTDARFARARMRDADAGAGR